MTKKEELELMQFYIIMNSYLYYELDYPILDDREFDTFCKCYLGKAKLFTDEELQSTRFYNALYDFDGTTGFDLVGRLTPVQYKVLKSMTVHQLWFYNVRNRDLFKETFLKSS